MTTNVLTKHNVLLNVKVKNQEEAIRQAGEVLVNGGYVKLDYIQAMFEREKSVSTYMGNHIAIPHGTDAAKKFVEHSGISILQIPEGVNYGSGNVAKLVIGIAGKNDEHLDILSKIAIVCSDETNVEKIVQAQTEEEILAIFEEEL